MKSQLTQLGQELFTLMLLLVSTAWLTADPGWEALLAFLLGLSGYGSFFLRRLRGGLAANIKPACGSLDPDANPRFSTGQRVPFRSRGSS
jgi:hypothetical protein